MRDLSCLSNKERESVAKWLRNEKDHGCWIKYKAQSDPNEDLMVTCDRTCGVVFPECKHNNRTLCPCTHLGEAYVIKELTS